MFTQFYRDCLMLFFFVTVSNNNDLILRYYKKERTIGNLQHGERSMSEILRKVERNRSSGVRREPSSTNVPLSAWTHQFLFEAYVAKRLHIPVAK